MVAIPKICARNRPISSREHCHSQTDALPKGLQAAFFADNSRSLSGLSPATKKPRDMPGASMLVAASARSVLRDHRAAELVVQAGGDEIDVLTDAVGAEGEAARRGEVVGTVLHEQVIVLDAN